MVNKAWRFVSCRGARLQQNHKIVACGDAVVEFLRRRYIKENAVERREYQVNLADQAKAENCIIVLPTGLGKTTIALQLIAHHMETGGGALFLAPTRVLVNQHYEFLKKNLTVQDISMVTGGDVVAKRAKLWENSVVCATPEITKNDLARGIVSPTQFSLVIFDEVHRTVGDYAYSAIAARFAGSGTRILGMTATLPSDREKATEIIKALRIESVAHRDESSPDVTPYIQHTHTRWVKVELPPQMRMIQAWIKVALDRRCTILRRNGVRIGDRPSLSSLLAAREQVMNRNRRSAKPLFTAIRIMYALNMLEAHGITTFLRFCERTSKKRGVGIRELFNEDPQFTAALREARRLQSVGVEHPKMQKLRDLIAEAGGKVLIFSSYRDSVDIIHKKLVDAGISAGILIGKAGETGLKQKKQVEAVERFRAGDYKVLIATRVGEEGLDISEVNQVIFYDNVPSSIRYIQRRGRTGRKSTGNLTVLMAAGTVDETYYWIGRRKIASARKVEEDIARNAEARSGLDAYI